MSFTTILGVISALVFLVIAITSTGDLGNFIDASSAMIVFGCTFAATIASYSPKQLTSALKATRFVFRKDPHNLPADIDYLLKMAEAARREGLLALEGMIGEIHDPFLKKGTMLVIDGFNSDLIKSVMQTDIDFTSARHSEVISVFKTIAAYAPAFGMSGTMVSLINMLLNMKDQSVIGPSMSLALITTFYGTLLANLVSNPIAKRLQLSSDFEQLRNEMVLEGILSIHGGENPQVIRDKLEAFLPSSMSRKNSSRDGAQS